MFSNNARVNPSNWTNEWLHRKDGGIGLGHCRGRRVYSEDGLYEINEQFGVCIICSVKRQMKKQKKKLDPNHKDKDTSSKLKQGRTYQLCEYCTFKSLTKSKCFLCDEHFDYFHDHK